jgi:hypothetical protein
VRIKGRDQPAARHSGRQIARIDKHVTVPRDDQRRQDGAKRPLFIRNLHASELLERFLISAVAALLSVRIFLALTGFPQLGGRGLHIAHLLWGGGLMLAALLMLLSYLGHRIRRTAALIGGVGFGLFIDELGKFITSDNDYFYRPAVAVIYVIFVLLFLWWRSLDRRRTWTEQTYLANALMLLQDTALHDLDQTEKHDLVEWLHRSGGAGKDLLGDIEPSVATINADVTPGRLAPAMRILRGRILSVARWRWSGRIAIAILVIRLLAAVATSLALLYSPKTTGPGESVDLPLLLAAGISGAITTIGVAYLLMRSRVNALRWFKRSILASIFLTDLFTFYYQQLGAIADLATDLILLAIFDTLTRAERHVTLSSQPYIDRASPS